MQDFKSVVIHRHHEVSSTYGQSSLYSNGLGMLGRRASNIAPSQPKNLLMDGKTNSLTKK